MQGRFAATVLWILSGAVLWQCAHSMTLIFPLPGPWLPTKAALATGVVMGALGYVISSEYLKGFLRHGRSVFRIVGLVTGAYLGWVSARGDSLLPAAGSEQVLSALVCGVLGLAANSCLYWLMERAGDRPFRVLTFLLSLLLLVLAAVFLLAISQPEILADCCQWETGPPVFTPQPAGGEQWLSVKDPSIVFFQGRWHLFCTVRGSRRSHAIVYTSFQEWDEADSAQRILLSCHDGYFCAPQVFYFRPQQKWYLICQASDDSWDPNYGPAFSVTEDISRPDSWSRLVPLCQDKPETAKAWLDFWVICDQTRAHLFFSSLDGKMWRSETALGDFPTGWSRPVVALEGDIFEASHTYRLRDTNRYLTLIEAQNGNGWRYYKAYLADQLHGLWLPLAAERDHSFASMKNVTQRQGRWTDSISHGELLRTGYDESLEVDPSDLQFLFQGVSDEERSGKSYGEIPWQLGILHQSQPQ